MPSTIAHPALQRLSQIASRLSTVCGGLRAEIAVFRGGCPEEEGRASADNPVDHESSDAGGRTALLSSPFTPLSSVFEESVR
jgi:hypothetical protein